VDPAVAAAYVAAPDNPGRRRVLLDALAGLNHYGAYALARFAATHAKDDADRADARATRHFAYAISPEYVPGHEPAGLEDFDELAKWDWSTRIAQLAPSLREHHDALMLLRTNALVPCIR